MQGRDSSWQRRSVRLAKVHLRSVCEHSADGVETALRPLEVGMSEGIKEALLALEIKRTKVHRIHDLIALEQ